MSALSLLNVIGIIVVVNYIVGHLNILNPKFDLTEKNIYTLSDGTKRIISRINPDEPVTLRFYATEDGRIMPQEALNYVTPVRDLLMEIEKEGRGKIKLERIDPRPSTEDEDKAIADDITSFNGMDGTSKFYLGLAIEAVDRKEIIPLLNPNDEASLEYYIARGISKVTSNEGSRVVVGVMSAMPIAGPAMNFPGMPQRTPPPWMFIQHLRQDYDVREVSMSSDTIDADVKILLVIHPGGITNAAQFAIDQFLLKGGKVIAMVDPRCMVSEAYNNPNQMQMGMAPPSAPQDSDLPELFKAWGVEYNKHQLVADMTYRVTVGRGKSVPTFLSVDRAGINTSEPIANALEKVQMFCTGAFSISAKEGITATRLLESSENSSFIDSSEAEKVQNEEMTNFQPEGKKKILALRLTGTFTTAFPEGAPKPEAMPPGGPKPPGIPGLPPGLTLPGAPGETGGEDKKDAGAPAAATTPAPAAAAPAGAAPAGAAPAGAAPAGAAPAAPVAPEALKKSANSEGMVFLFADADMLYDVFALQRDQSGRAVPIPINSNIPMMLNIMEMASGSSDLVAVRSRASSHREFTKMNELMSSVEAKYRPVIEEQNAALNKIVGDIASLSGAKQEQGVVFLNPNKQQLQQLKDKQLEIQKKKRDAEKELKKQKDHLEMIITTLNMAAVPLLVVAIGLVLAMRRHSIQAAH
ncbi:GldG family protein [Roseimicrobium gellanilyticum]|uniref:GldG family protein n=1 Tax=Roseimicrobium gellanilyticum TaxID=748857 RepID=UPI001B880CC0|nr:GldG family protein [Roseimicrobium gellanilyticum]